MPSIRRKFRRIARHEWTDGHRTQLDCSHDFFGDGWGDAARLPRDERSAWPSSAIEAEMREAWDDLRDELMDAAKDTLRRPWAWWWIEQGVGIRERVAHETLALDLMGLLTPTALAKAATDEMVTRGIRNDAHEKSFRRSWGWWKFTSPEWRDFGIPEAVQLVNLEKRGAEVLTDRERTIWTTKDDVATYKHRCVCPRLSRAECDALELPDDFYSEREDELFNEELEFIAHWSAKANELI